MQWLEITIKTEPGKVDEIAGALTVGGFPELIIEDQTEFEAFLENNKAYWDYIDEALQKQLQGLSRIKLYLEDTDKAGLEKLRALVKELGLFMEEKPLEETNWEESWKENYPPQPVGNRLTVLPYWLSDMDTDGRLPVILDPGLTFGTGAHPSTRMVLETMEERVKEGDACIDLGSGSGILSIAALRLGAKSAVGVDIDPKAEDIARENAAYNGFGAPEFTAFTGNVLSDKKLMETLKARSYDVVLVNIVADVIVALSPVLPAFLDKHSILICSGILEDRLSDVKEALKNAGLSVESVKECEEWRCVTAKKVER